MSVKLVNQLVRDEVLILTLGVLVKGAADLLGGNTEAGAPGPAASFFAALPTSFLFPLYLGGTSVILVLLDGRWDQKAGNLPFLSNGTPLCCQRPEPTTAGSQGTAAESELSIV